MIEAESNCSVRVIRMIWTSFKNSYPKTICLKSRLFLKLHNLFMSQKLTHSVMACRCIANFEHGVVVRIRGVTPRQFSQVNYYEGLGLIYAARQDPFAGR